MIILIKNHARREIMELTAKYADSPLDWVMFAFPWDSAPSAAVAFAANADVHANAASAAYAAVAASYAVAKTAKTQYQKKTANICRKYLPIKIWNNI